MPFLIVLAPSKKANESEGKRHKTSNDWTRQMVCVVSRWLKRPWILVGDGAYACMDLTLTCIARQAILISCLRLDAQLFEFPVFEKKKLGCKPIKGKRICLKDILKDPSKIWCKEAVFCYGGETRDVEYLSFICL